MSTTCTAHTHMIQHKIVNILIQVLLSRWEYRRYF